MLSLSFTLLLLTVYIITLANYSFLVVVSVIKPLLHCKAVFGSALSAPGCGLV